MRVAYLASRDTLPGTERRADAFEYDRMFDALVGAYAAQDLELIGVAWDDDEVDWSGFQAAQIGTTWDYWERQPEFLERLAAIEAQVPLFNPVETVRWNSDKRYLADFPIPPTLFVEDPTEASVRSAFESLDVEWIVVKRQVGAGAYGQHLLKHGQDVPALDQPVLIQPFLHSIAERGEISVVLVDGQISHAIRKLPKSGDYRIQSMYGGIETVHELTGDERALALAVAPAGLLYARVDLVYLHNEPLLMELELIEPYLYPAQGPELGTHLARALAKRLA